MRSNEEPSLKACHKVTRKHSIKAIGTDRTVSQVITQDDIGMRSVEALGWHQET